LDAFRTAIGYDTLVGTTTHTWKWMVEGYPLRWLQDWQDYPLIILTPGETTFISQTRLQQNSIPVAIYIALRHERLAEPRIYEATRVVGEAVVESLRSAGHHLGTDFISNCQVQSAGLEYELTEALADHKVGVYGMMFNVTYYQCITS
jgi:hypothetical protein